jgi:uncharacterized protein (DUF58 family)
MDRSDPHGGPTWRVSVAHARAMLLAGVLTAAAVVARRPDLLVLGVPFGVIVAWTLAVRPRGAPSWNDAIGHEVIREGAATRWRAVVSAEERCDVVAAELPSDRWIERRPGDGAVVAAVVEGTAVPEIVVRPTRWGRHRIGPIRLTVSGPWGGYRWSDRTGSHRLTALPLAAPFDSTAPFRPADGLVGQYRSARRGEGSEFATIREFRPGDRVRRINWPRSLRAGDLHVNATWADQDSHLALVLDASDDIGAPGSQATASSLDIGVRAAAAIAEHAARRGDRVSLHVYGRAVPRHVAPGAGRTHTRRILDVLTDVEPADRRQTSTLRTGDWTPGASGAALVVMLSPLVASHALDRAVELTRRGLSVVVIDTLPAVVDADSDPVTALAWRIRRLERRREIRRIERLGIAVVPWRGPGSLDQFLRDVARRAAAPKVRVR